MYIYIYIYTYINIKYTYIYIYIYTYINIKYIYVYIYDIYTKLCSKKNQRTSVVFLADRPSEQEQAEAEMRRLRSKQEPEATDVSLCNPKKKVGK